MSLKTRHSQSRVREDVRRHAVQEFNWPHTTDWSHTTMSKQSLWSGADRVIFTHFMLIRQLESARTFDDNRKVGPRLGKVENRCAPTLIKCAGYNAASTRSRFFPFMVHSKKCLRGHDDPGGFVLKMQKVLILFPANERYPQPAVIDQCSVSHRAGFVSGSDSVRTALSFEARRIHGQQSLNC